MRDVGATAVLAIELSCDQRSLRVQPERLLGFGVAQVPAKAAQCPVHNRCGLCGDELVNPGPGLVEDGEIDVGAHLASEIRIHQAQAQDPERVSIDRAVQFRVQHINGVCEATGVIARLDSVEKQDVPGPGRAGLPDPVPGPTALGPGAAASRPRGVPRARRRGRRR